MPHNFKVSANNMNEKTGFEMILKRCEHVVYAAVRTIGIITISVITNQISFTMSIPINKCLLRFSLFLKLSQALYINWIAWSTEFGAIYKNISKFKKKNTRCKSVC